MRGKTWRFVLGGVSAFGASLMTLAIPQVLGALINGPLLGSGSLPVFLLATAGVLVLGVLEAVLIASRRQFVMYPGTRVEAEMRVSLFDHLLDLPVAFHTRWGTGQLLSRSMSDLGTLRRWLAFGVIMLVVSALTVVVGVALMFVTAWQLGLLYLAAVIPVVVMSFVFRRRYRVETRLSQDQSGDLATLVEESVLGIRVLKAFGRGGHALERFSESAHTLRRTELRKASALSTLSLVMTLVPEIALGVGLFVGVWMAANGTISIGAVVAFFSTAVVLASPLERIGALFAVTLDAFTAMDRYREVESTRNTILDPAVSRPAPPRGELVFSDVTLHHRDAGMPDVLARLDLRIPAGETLAIVGASGSGKSALASLIPRLEDVDEGRILLDGVDVRDLSRADLRSRVSIAFEDPVLFTETVRDNVLLGAADRSDEVLNSALRLARADFVHRLPDGVDTVVGEEGLNLSGGQRQRLALARAIANRPAVIVLDNAMSALDVHTEEAVHEGLRDALRDTTTIVVAHRPSTVSLADRVLVLRGGRVHALGTHRELLREDDYYRDIFAGAEGPLRVE